MTAARSLSCSTPTSARPGCTSPPSRSAARSSPAPPSMPVRLRSNGPGSKQPSRRPCPVPVGAARARSRALGPGTRPHPPKGTSRSGTRPRPTRTCTHPCGLVRNAHEVHDAVRSAQPLNGRRLTVEDAGPKVPGQRRSEVRCEVLDDAAAAAVIGTVDNWRCGCGREPGASPPPRPSREHRPRKQRQRCDLVGGLAQAQCQSRLDDELLAEAGSWRARHRHHASRPLNRAGAG